VRDEKKTPYRNLATSEIQWPPPENKKRKPLPRVLNKQMKIRDDGWAEIGLLD